MDDEARVQALERALSNSELERQELRRTLATHEGERTADQRRIEALAARVTTLRAEISEAVQRLRVELDSFPAHVPDWTWETLAGPVDRCQGVLHDLLIAAGIESVRPPSVRQRGRLEPAPAVVTVLADRPPQQVEAAAAPTAADAPAETDDSSS